MPVEVSVDIPSLSRGSSGNITGVIFLTDGIKRFPEPTWNDFPVIIVGSWLEALHELRRSGKSASCRFMDGPFEVRVSSDSNSAWRVDWLDGEAKQPSWSTSVTPAAFLNSVQAAGRALVAACQNRGWHSQEVETLARLSLAKLGGA